MVVVLKAGRMSFYLGDNIQEIPIPDK
jgi:hypothetical protein